MSQSPSREVSPSPSLETSLSLSREVTPELDESNSLTCDRCRRTYATRYSLRRHERPLILCKKSPNGSLPETAKQKKSRRNRRYFLK